jgi:CheY-like chemotaxis protein
MARILIADDDAATRDLLRRALEVDGHAVKAAADGAEALELIRAGLGVDLLITDVQMPGIDGIRLAAEAAALRPGLRLLMMSGYPDQLARAAALPVARVLTLSKPFTLDKARAEVRAALG